jgi:hypothetical protein
LLLVVSFPAPHRVVEVSVANRNAAVGGRKIWLIVCIRAMYLFRCSKSQGRVRPVVVI